MRPGVWLATSGGPDPAPAWGPLTRRVAAALGPPATGSEPLLASPLVGVRWSLTYAGFLLYMFVMLSVRFPLGDVAIAMSIAGLMTQAGGPRVAVPMRWLALFGAWAAIVSLGSRYPSWVSTGLTDFLKLWLIGLVAYNALQSRRHIRLAMIFFVFCFALFPIRGTFITFFVYGEHDSEGRAGWIQLYSNPNDLGSMALLQLAMVVALLTAEPKGWVRRIAVVLLVLLPLLILITQSRGVFLGLVVFLAVVFAGQRRRVRLTLQMAVVAALLSTVMPEGVWDRIGTMRHATSTSNLAKVDGKAGSAKHRYEIWRVAFAIIEDHPVTGVGFNAYKPAHFAYSASPRYDQAIHGYWNTHSMYLNVLAETGYPGLALFGTFVGGIALYADRVRRAWKRRDPPYARQLLVLEAGLLGVLISCVFGSLAWLPHLHLHLAFLYCLARAQPGSTLNAVAVAPQWPRRGEPAPPPGTARMV